MGGKKTRNHVRIKLDASATLIINGPTKGQVSLPQEGREAAIVDISITGLGVISTMPFSQGAMLRIQMDGAKFNMDKPINIRGEVRYCKPQREKEYRLGIKFVEVEDRDLNKIKEYINKYIHRKAPKA